ncbi:putative bifunctional diguanylate cyclase/phosphodiesterase [Devosia soli]|uniref:putative bifunctional diguanylate cyclase/phosphodiesterase n=1 Tax=Devosia soli TaxID=361041 RepID=UPI00069A7A34|nr:EAL domain-containing protein [Devosia soli]
MAIVCGFSASWAAGRIDALAQAQQRTAVRSALVQAAERFAADQDIVLEGGYFIGEDRNSGIDRNLTTDLGHDRTYLVGPDGAVLRASERGRYAGRAYQQGDGAVVKPIVERLRLKIASVQFDDPGLGVDGAIGLRAVEKVAFTNGDIGLLGVRPIDPPLDAPPVTGNEYLLVSIKIVTPAVLAEMSEHIGITGLARASRPVADASLPILGPNGNVLTYLVWNPSRPARGLLLEAAPALALMMIFGGALMAIILAWLRQTSLRLEASQAHATYFALHDPLTGAANRTLFDTKLREAGGYEYLAETKVLLISIDVDHFKQINDTWGHAAGDELLKEVAKRLQLEMPEDATIARLGGDEFAIVHPGIVGDGQARWICHRLVQCARTPFQIGQEALSVSLSIGAALERAEDVTPEEMMRRADVALYAAKVAGRDGMAMYEPAMDQEKRDRRRLEIELRNAILTGEGLQVVYQPIYSTKTHGVAAAEALVRWTHPMRGLLPPDMFIGLAEDCGIIDQLGMFVLRQAARFAVKTGLSRIAVNFSPVQFKNERLAEDVLAAIAEEGLSPERLEVEITEGMLLKNSQQVQRLLKTLREAGVSIALDDFGTGYASISYLRNYQVDKLKIDQSYTRLVSTDAAVGEIVRLIIGTAHALGMVVTAEGVEDVEQQKALAAMGCTYLQGYLLSRPLSAEQMQDMLDRGNHPRRAHG